MEFDTPDSEDEYEKRKQELIEDARETKQELDKEQQEILQGIQEEHGGDLIETPVSITSDHSATIRTKLDGSLINRMTAIDDAISNGGGLHGFENAMDRASTLLDDILVEDEYNKHLFYGVYEQEGPKALGQIVEKVFDAIEEEQKRKAGAVDGFRQDG